MSVHTAIPWQIGFEDGSGQDMIVSRKAGEIGTAVAVVNWGCGCCKHEPKKEELDNAAFIVQAVNSHAELVAALGEIIHALENNIDDGQGALAIANGAYAKLEQK